MLTNLDMYSLKISFASSGQNTKKQGINKKNLLKSS